MNRSKLLNRMNALLLMMFSSGSVFASDTWKFKVFLDDQEIGEHVFEVAEHKNETHVRINADFNVYFLFINAYEYRHENYEVWNNECLQSVKSRTNDNGEELYVQAEYSGERFVIQTSSGQYNTEGCIQSFAYWDPDFLKSQQLLNAQTGEIMPVNIEKIGEEVILVRSRLTSTTHYRLTTDEFVIDLWYSKNNEWLALNSTTRNGSTLRYQIQ
jgi:hypothetical protein